MRALLYVLGAAVALAALKVALQAIIAFGVLLLIGGLILDPRGALTLVGAIVLLGVFLSSPSAVLLSVIAVFLAATILRVLDIP